MCSLQVQVLKGNNMSNKKPTVTQCPTVPVEEEIEEDLKVIDETETPLLTGQYYNNLRNN